MLEIMARAKTIAELKATREEITAICRETETGLPGVDSRQMVINRRIIRLTYAHRCIEGVAVQAHRDHGVEIAPSMKIEYVVTDALWHQVKATWCAKSFDHGYYRELIDKALVEISFALTRGNWGTGMNKDVLIC